jgi:putative hydrolase
MEPAEALARILHCLDRSLDGGFRTKAFASALDTVRATEPDELRRLAAARRLRDLPGIGDSSAKVITEALAGEVPEYLRTLEAQTTVPLSEAARPYREALRGDCHSHTRWSDGGASVREMVGAARALGHEYLVITDHSPRLTVAHGLDPERLARQLDEIDDVRAEVGPFRILTGMEVDILEDGALDLDDELLGRLDVVVGSVHSKLKMPHREMTYRMLKAIESPHVDILGHCTGRMIDKRAPSSFDAARVFAACAEHRTAVEINCRPERLDPPDELLAMALDAGCEFTIDSDAHATGQLEWQPFGCEKAATVGVPIDRIVNSRDADGLLAWTAR